MTQRMITTVAAVAVLSLALAAQSHAAVLVGHWTLDETSGNTAVDSVNGNNGAWQNGSALNLSRPAGVIGGAAGLLDNGSGTGNNFFTISSIPQFIGADGVSISAWIDPDVQNPSSGYNGIFMTRTFNGQTGNSWGIAIEGAGTEHLDSRVDGPGFDSPNGSLSPAAGWIHVASVYDANTKTHRQYVNGVQTVSVSVASDPQLGATIAGPNSGPWYIGYDDCCGNTRDFDGKIDDVSVWTGALTGAQVQQLYTAGLHSVSAAGALAFNAPVSALPVTPGLQLWLDSSDVSTFTTTGQLVSQWRDKSGLNHHASQGTASLQPSLTSGGINGLPVVAFNRDQLTIAGGLPIAAGQDRTVFIVFDYTTLTNNSEMFGVSTGQMIDVGNFNQSQRLRLRDSSDVGDIYSGNGSLPTGSHILVVQSLGGNTFASGDGLTLINAAGGYFDFNLNGPNLGIGGANFAGREFIGSIAEVLVFDRALSAGEVNGIGVYLAQKYGIETTFAVPEPATLGLLALGFAGLVRRRRTRA